ncbi:hypothetical protein E2562_011466 [Oryza meyeriana var. granulata]|uniref:Uncharacterized protein n=1 Tax=Oryza meyeriana var. granulata TaxID=110450 RepID=A0A6G1D2W0_9ORYZ|nr:hypothetical protein E2562_011466 [Oryza meyeriana var. granulata]
MQARRRRLRTAALADQTTAAHEKRRGQGLGTAGDGAEEETMMVGPTARQTGDNRDAEVTRTTVQRRRRTGSNRAATTNKGRTGRAAWCSPTAGENDGSARRAALDGGSRAAALCLGVARWAGDGAAGGGGARRVGAGDCTVTAGRLRASGSRIGGGRGG